VSLLVQAAASVFAVPLAIRIHEGVVCVARHDVWPVSDTGMAGRCASLGWPDLTRSDKRYFAAVRSG
jgi:hypothetical protein